MDVLLSHAREPPSRNVSWREAFVLNQRNLVQIAAWALSEQDIIRIFQANTPNLSKRPGLVRQYMRRMNREETRAVMHILAWGACESGGESSATFSLHKLASIVDPSRASAMEKTLKKTILPALADAGYIQGCEDRRAWSTVAHQISITPKGLQAHLEYLSKCSEYCQVLDEELRSLG